MIFSSINFIEDFFMSWVLSGVIIFSFNNFHWLDIKTCHIRSFLYLALQGLEHAEGGRFWLVRRQVIISFLSSLTQSESWMNVTIFFTVLFKFLPRVIGRCLEIFWLELFFLQFVLILLIIRKDLLDKQRRFRIIQSWVRWIHLEFWFLSLY